MCLAHGRRLGRGNANHGDVGPDVRGLGGCSNRVRGVSPVAGLGAETVDPDGPTARPSPNTHGLTALMCFQHQRAPSTRQTGVFLREVSDRLFVFICGGD